MIATTIEQSKHLLELGLDSKSADMCWVKDYIGQWVLIADTQINIRSRFEGMYEYSGFKWQEHIELVPAWSLSALLEVISKVTCISYLTIDTSFLIRCKDLGFLWLKNIAAKDPVTAAYEMVCWLLTNNLITNY